MTVLENVAIGAHLRGDFRAQGGVSAAILRMNRAEEQKLLFEARRQLERVGLADAMYMEAGSLALGQQRILEIARCAATQRCCCSTSRLPGCATRKSRRWPTCCASCAAKA